MAASGGRMGLGVSPVGCEPLEEFLLELSDPEPCVGEEAVEDGFLSSEEGESLCDEELFLEGTV